MENRRYRNGSHKVRGNARRPFRHARCLQKLANSAAIHYSLFPIPCPDDTATVYYNYRHYLPETGRWMSRDPLSVQVDLYGVWDINVERNFLALELYCMNSPISLYDNRGMAPNNSRRIVNNLILLASWWNEDCARCGPDITDSLKALRINVFSEFEQLKRTNPSKARSSCSIFSPGSFSELKYAISGWDIVGLAFEDMRIRRENGVSRCPFGNGCSETVMVNGQCHWKWSVNYLLFGWMAKLCDCPKERMSKLIRAWKTIKPKDYGKINNAVSFAEWAYDGFPDGGCWKKRNSVIANLVTVTRTFISAPNGPIMQQGMAQGDKRFVMSNHFVKGFAVGFGLGVILMVVAVVSYFS